MYTKKYVKNDQKGYKKEHEVEKHSQSKRRFEPSREIEMSLRCPCVKKNRCWMDT